MTRAPFASIVKRIPWEHNGKKGLSAKINIADALRADVWNVVTIQFEKRKAKWFPQGDVFHMGPDGNYLQALVWTAKLFNVDVTKCGYAPKGMDVERAAFLREIAMKSIRPSCGLR